MAMNLITRFLSSCRESITSRDFNCKFSKKHLLEKNHLHVICILKGQMLRHLPPF
ncbi:hypothetical protein Hanom_Chr17g01543271 [Helianthus anomalus]